MTEWYWVLVSGILSAIVMGILVFFLTQKYIQKQLDKNPPITAKQIRTMYAQMGRKPSEKQVNQIMNSMKKKK